MYFVADSFKGYELIGEPYYNEKHKLYSKAKCACPRCSGHGIIASRVENGQIIPIPVAGGICFQCEGRKYITKEVRLYTEAEYNTMQKNKARAEELRKEKAEQDRIKNFKSVEEKWLKDNGFNAEGSTFIYFPEDSYNVKDELKEQGFKFHHLLLWHTPVIPEGYEDKVIGINILDIAEQSAFGWYSYKTDAKTFIEDRLTKARPHKEPSEWIGKENDRFTDISVTFVSIREIEGRFGYTQLVKFETDTNDEIDWWTTKRIDLESNDRVLLSGIIKKLDTYKDKKITVVKNCKFKVD